MREGPQWVKKRTFDVGPMPAHESGHLMSANSSWLLALFRSCIPQHWRKQMSYEQHHHQRSQKAAWTAGRSIGPKRALKPQQVWEIRFHLEHERRLRDRAMFDIAIDSKLRGCDIVKLRMGDVVVGGLIRQRSMVI